LRDFTAAAALDKPQARHYNAASSEGKPSGSDPRHWYRNTRQRNFATEIGKFALPETK
jgi:hypothetical protein